METTYVYISRVLYKGAHTHSQPCNLSLSIFVYISANNLNTQKIYIYILIAESFLIVKMLWKQDWPFHPQGQLTWTASVISSASKERPAILAQAATPS